MKVDHGFGWYVLTPLVSYILFLVSFWIDNKKIWRSLYHIMSLIYSLLLYVFMAQSFWCQIMPKYTQCTSLGELVRKKYLVDVDARVKLDRAKVMRLVEIDNFEAEKEVAKNMTVRTTNRKRQNSAGSNLLGRFMFGSKQPLVEKEKISGQNVMLTEISQLTK